MFVLLLGFMLAASGHAALAPNLTRDATLTMPQLAEAYGYPSETHSVTTEDGYVLTLHRIPGEGEPVFLQHGLFCSSVDWVVTRPGHALAYALADKGYDVWLGNFRGNTYSRKHIKYTTSSKNFWDFSWHENGKYDLPAMIDYVLNVTGKEKLYYAGHSMGTTSYFVMTSERPEYNDKIRAMFALAPIIFMGHVTSPFLKSIAWTYRFDEIAWNALGWYEFFPSSTILKWAGQTLCQDKAVTQSVCTNIVFLLVGYDTENLNATELPVILAHTPAGASGKQLLHYSQEVVSGHFRQWDYGIISNALTYKSATPPDYDLSKSTAPVFLFYADNDWMSNIVDVEKLNSSLPNVQSHHVDWPSFNHLDYIWGINAMDLVYDVILDALPKY